MEDQMERIKKNLKVSQDRKKSYAEKNKAFRYFKVGEHLFLKVKVKRSSLILGSYPNLQQDVVDPFKYYKIQGQCHTFQHFMHQFECIIDLGGYWWPPTISNWLILTVFGSTRFYVMMKFSFNCRLCTCEDVLNPYTTCRWILVSIHLFQLDYFGSLHIGTSLCTSRVILGP